MRTLISSAVIPALLVVGPLFALCHPQFRSASSPPRLVRREPVPGQKPTCIGGGRDCDDHEFYEDRTAQYMRHQNQQHLWQQPGPGDGAGSSPGRQAQSRDNPQRPQAEGSDGKIALEATQQKKLQQVGEQGSSSQEAIKPSVRRQDTNPFHATSDPRQDQRQTQQPKSNVDTGKPVELSKFTLSQHDRQVNQLSGSSKVLASAGSRPSKQDLLRNPSLYSSSTRYLPPRSQHDPSKPTTRTQSVSTEQRHELLRHASHITSSSRHFHSLETQSEVSAPAFKGHNEQRAPEVDQQHDRRTPKWKTRQPSVQVQHPSSPHMPQLSSEADAKVLQTAHQTPKPVPQLDSTDGKPALQRQPSIPKPQPERQNSQSLAAFLARQRSDVRETIRPSSFSERIATLERTASPRMPLLRPPRLLKDVPTEPPGGRDFVKGYDPFRPPVGKFVYEKLHSWKGHEAANHMNPESTEGPFGDVAMRNFGGMGVGPFRG